MLKRPPTFNNSLSCVPRTRRLTLHLHLSPSQATANPLFTSSLSVVINRNNFRNSNNTQRNIDKRTMALFSGSPRSINSRATTFPIRINGISQHLNNHNNNKQHRRTGDNRHTSRRRSGSFRTSRLILFATVAKQPNTRGAPTSTCSIG